MRQIVDALELNKGGTKLSRSAWLVLFGFALFAYLPGFFTIPTWDRDEARYSQASRQMMETGDYIDIRFQDQARHVKPAGIYWLQVSTAAPLGGAEAPQWAYRLPSLFGCLVAIGLTAWFGARFSGPGTGFVAGLLLAIIFSMGVEARMAKTDAVLLASVTLAQVSLFQVLRPDADKASVKFVGWPLIFWLAQGLGLMIKGPIITMVSGLTLLSFCLWRRDWSLLKRLHFPVGILAMLAVVLPWVITITIQTQGGFIEKSIGHALMGKVATGDDSHGAPPGYHTLALLLTFWPGSLLLAFAGINAWKRRTDPIVQYLLCWLLPTWLVFEIVATKLPHYVMPVMPALALLAASGITGMLGVERTRRDRILHWSVFALFLVSTAVLASAVWVLAEEIGAAPPSTAWAVSLCAVLVAICGGWLALKPSIDRLFPLAVASVVFYILLFAMTLPTFDRLWLSRDLRVVSEGFSGCETYQYATLGYREPSVVFQFGTETLLAEGADAIEHLEQNADCGVIAVSQIEQERFLERARLADMPLKVLGSVKGYNYTKGDDLDMTWYAQTAAKVSVEAPEAQ